MEYIKVNMVSTIPTEIIKR